jgi:hypothetical protein
MTEPKVFISYSWSTPVHEQWVLRLATDLRGSGLDVILDKWDLKEGHDAHAFMERMVTDPDIKKVVLVCDKAYVDKTNGRKGGVGTEAQIISPEIYAEQAQDKFVAIVTERDEAGKPYLPAYYKSRIYIDFWDESVVSESFDQLVRWAFDQPLHQKPPVGQKPAFLREEAGSILLGTSARHRRAMEALKNARDHALPAVREYFDLLSTELEKFRVKPDAEPFDDAIVASIDAFLPYRNEAIELFHAIGIYKDTQESRTVLHRFFESLIPYLESPQNVTAHRDWDFDNFKFIVHELFLYSLACLIRHERFEAAAYLMANEYYVAGRSEYGRDVMVPFAVFRSYMKSLEFRNSRLKLNRLSVRADLLSQRCKGVGIEFRQLMQADFVLFLRDKLHQTDTYKYWWPETLLYSGRQAGSFEVFARSRSASYFDRAKCLLGIDTKEDLAALMKIFAEQPAERPRWQFESVDPASLLGFNELAIKP